MSDSLLTSQPARATVRPSQSQKLRSMFLATNRSEETALLKDEQQKKNWEKVLRNFTFEPPNDEFYMDFPVKPGFWFWKTLASAEKGLEELRVAIPHSFVVLGNNSFAYLSYDRKTRRIVRKSEQETTLTEFERVLFDQVDPRYKEEDYYLLVHRSPGRMENEVNKNVFTNFSWQSKRAMSSGVESPSMLQAYVYPKGHHVSVTRICFKTANNKETRSSYGFKFTNYQRLHDKESKKSVSNKATICKDAEFSFDVSPVFSGNISILRPKIESVVAFLQRAGNVHITEIVCDFITDRSGEPVLFNVKALNMLSCSVKLHKNIEELSCSVYCTLCGNMFKRDDARKLLTYKLLWEFEKHLQKRGIKLPGMDTAHNSTRPCKVCDLCYTVVVSEHKLIEYEQNFALAQNVRIKELFIKVKSEKRPKNRPHFVPSVLKQWRLLLLIKEIRFDRKHEEFLANLRWEDTPFFFQVKLGCAKFSFQLKFDRKWTDKESFVFSVKVLKIFYLFSLPDESIEPFLTETDLIFRLTDSEVGGGSVNGHGASKTLANFKWSESSGQKHENVVYLFFGETIFAPMKIVVGLVSDGESDTSSLNLYKVGPVYFPDEDFYNCNIFPGQWMEIFTDGHLDAGDEDGARNRPDFKIKSNLVFLESVLQGKFDIQNTLLNMKQTKKTENNRPYSNISNMSLATSAYPDKSRISMKAYRSPLKPTNPSANSCEATLLTHKAGNSVPSNAFRIKKSLTATLADTATPVTAWAVSHQLEESMYQDYLRILGKDTPAPQN